MLKGGDDRLEKNALALQKEAKAYLEAIRSMSASSTRIAATIDLFFGSDAGEQAMSANAYKRAVEDMESSVTASIDTPYRTTVLDPVSKLCSYLPEVNNLIQKRSKKARVLLLSCALEPDERGLDQLLDYDAAKTKLRKLSDNTSADPIKLRQVECAV